MPAEDIECVAQWSINQYTISFNSNGGSSVSDIKQNYGTSVTKPADPTKEGYTFNGWLPIVPGTMPAEDIECVAQWNVNSYTVTLHTNEGTINSGNVTSYTYGVGATLPSDVTRANHIFEGWFANSSFIGDAVTTISTTATGDKEFWAKWKLNNFDVTFDVQGHGTAPDAQSVTPNGKVTKPDDPSAAPEHYRFDGWYKESACTNAWNFSSDEVTANTTLYAKWTRLYTIEWYDAQEGLGNGVGIGHHVIKREQYAEGDTPSFSYEYEDGRISDKYDKPSDGIYRYIVHKDNPWDPAIEPVTKDQRYTAIYDARVASKDIGTANGETLVEEVLAFSVNADVTTVHKNGRLDVNGKTLTTTDFVLEATPEASGELIGNVVAENIYFDLILGDTEPRHWHAFTVPFVVNLKKAGKPIQINGETLTLGRGYDIVYYDGSVRASQGKTANCWKYVEDGDSILNPGKAYMIASASRAINVVRFQKSTDYIGKISVAQNSSSTGVNNDGGWNGIGNPMMFHALLDAGVTLCQVHDGGKIGADGYHTYKLKDKKLVVGKAIYVQVAEADDEVEVTMATDQGVISELSASAAPRRRSPERIQTNSYEVHIAPAEGESADHIYLLTDENKEDKYVILADLAKAGVSPVRAQIWVDRYGDQLCMNTVAPINGQANYPLGISIPNTGEYEIYIASHPEEDEVLYLTLDGRPIWNLTYGGYTANLEKGTTNRYGLLIVQKSPKVATGFEEITIENGELVRKVLVDDKVYIIRNGEVFTITGQLVK